MISARHKIIFVASMVIGVSSMQAMAPQQPNLAAQQALLERINTLTLQQNGMISDQNLIQDLQAFAIAPNQYFLFNTGLAYAQPGKNAQQTEKYLDLVINFLSGQGESGDLEFGTDHRKAVYSLLQALLMKLISLKKVQESGV